MSKKISAPIPADDQLALVHSTLDSLGVECGDLALRLAFLRGAALGFRAPPPEVGMATGVAQEPAPATPATDPGSGSKKWVPHPEPASVKIKLEPGMTAEQILESSEGTLDPGEAAALAQVVAAVTALPNHNPSWKIESNRKGFFGLLSDMHIADSYYTIASFCEAHNMKRPSQMGEDERLGFLNRLRKPENRFRFDEWCAKHGDAVPQ